MFRLCRHKYCASCWCRYRLNGVTCRAMIRIYRTHQQEQAVHQPVQTPVQNAGCAHDSSMNTPPSLSQWLKQLRTQHDLTQETLAQQVGCSAEMIRALE